MHLISFDASPRQVSKLRNGHSVRIKKGAGFNLVVNPSSYHLVSRAFNKNKGVQIKLAPEEIEVNESLSPEQHEELGSEMDKNLFEHLPFAEGGSIFKKAKKALYSKTAKKIGRELRPVTRIMKDMARETAHQKIAEAHQAGAERYGDDPRMAHLLSTSADLAHHKVGGNLRGVAGKVKKALYSKTAKRIGREVRPITRIMKDMAKEAVHEKIAQAHQAGAERYGEDPRMMELLNASADLAHHKTQRVGADRAYGSGMGAGMGAGMGGGLIPSRGMYGMGMNVHDALRMANLATANANHQLSKMHNASVHGQITQPPIKRYWDEVGAPPSRGTGIHNHYNMIRGRGSLLSQDDILPPALQSQPYGANFHMQFFLPPEYHRYNDGGEIEGRGLYV